MADPGEGGRCNNTNMKLKQEVPLFLIQRTPVKYICRTMNSQSFNLDWSHVINIAIWSAFEDLSRVAKTAGET